MAETREEAVAQLEGLRERLVDAGYTVHQLECDGLWWGLCLSHYTVYRTVWGWAAVKGTLTGRASTERANLADCLEWLEARS